VAGASGVGPALSVGVPFDAASTTGLLSAGFAHGGVFALGERDLLGGGRRVFAFRLLDHDLARPVVCLGGRLHILCVGCDRDHQDDGHRGISDERAKLFETEETLVG
jgi:hypothetical protein